MRPLAELDLGDERRLDPGDVDARLEFMDQEGIAVRACWSIR